MITNLPSLLIGLLIVLLFVMIFFAVLDKLLKGDIGKKKPAPKTEESKKVAKEQVPEKPKPEEPTQPAMKIYNSELADDLAAMIKAEGDTSTTRLQIEKHTNRESNIAKYIQSKNYHGFDFGTEESAAEKDNEDLTFTSEDYKRIVALGNIDDAKPL